MESFVVTVKELTTHCVKREYLSGSISPYSVQMWENKDQKNSEYEHFLCSYYGKLFIVVGVLDTFQWLNVYLED